MMKIHNTKYQEQTWMALSLERKNIPGTSSYSSEIVVKMV